MVNAGTGDEHWIADPRFEHRELVRPQFPTLRKGGLDPEAVTSYLDRIERVGDQLVKFTRELEARISHAKAEASDARRLEQKAVDAAMLAAFEAKDRILLEAEERAWEIEEAARVRAGAHLAERATDDRAVEVERLNTTIERLERELAQWRQRVRELAGVDDPDTAASPFVGSLHGEGGVTAPWLPGAAEQAAAGIVAAAQDQAGEIIAAAREQASAIGESASALLISAESRAAEVAAAQRESAQLTESAAADRHAAAQLLAEANARVSQIDGEALDAARTKAEALLADAEQRADATLESAKTEALAILDAAEHRRATLLAEATVEAESEAHRIVEAARTEAELVVTSAREAMRDAGIPDADELANAQTTATTMAQRIVDEARLRAEQILDDAATRSAESQRLLEEAHTSRTATQGILEQAKQAVRNSIVEARQAVLDAQDEAARIIADAHIQASGTPRAPVHTESPLPATPFGES